MDKLLSAIASPHDLYGLSPTQLKQLAGEMRDALLNMLIEAAVVAGKG